MEFTKSQIKFFNSKSSGYQLLKGHKGTGKSTASIYRAINLENNYCMYADDKVAIITSGFNEAYKALELYDKEKIKEHFYSLFSLEKDRVEVHSIKDLIEMYSKAYKRNAGISFSYVEQGEDLRILSKIVEEKRQLWKKSKFMIKADSEFLLKEINWIKACAFLRTEYLDIDRKGREKRIKKNAITREYIYDLLEMYNEELIANKFMDCYDDVLFAIKNSKKEEKKYTHIILDDCESLTKGEIEFIKSIYSNGSCSSLIFIVNSEISDKENIWLIKGRKVNTLGEDFKGKSYVFKNVFEDKSKKKELFIDKFNYIDLKHKSIFEFKRDTSSNKKEIFIDDNTSFSESEVKELPVYSDIAAGEPILMSSNLEDTFYLPETWVGNGKDNFILSVKGDSMIDKNINDGDLVVIKRQNSAYHNDIVAVDLEGSATLKTLNLNGDSPMLMPANIKYNPITLEDREANILGVAIGIIKNKM